MLLMLLSHIQQMLADLLPIVHQLRSILGELGTEIQLVKDKG